MRFTDEQTDRQLLRQLHWLKVPERIDYKLALLVYKCLQGLRVKYGSADMRICGLNNG